MNQAKSRPLRTRHLLLLVPLLLASAPPSPRAEVPSLFKEQPVNLLPGVPAKFELQLPPGAEAGKTISVTVGVYDSFNNVVTNFTGPIRFESGDPRAVLPVDPKFEAADQGKKTFSVSLESAGSKTLTVIDARALPTLSSVTQNIGVLPGPAKFFQLRTSARPATAGAPLDVTLGPTDAYGNQTFFDPDWHVQLATSDGRAGLPGDVPFGSGTLRMTFRTAGRHTLSASAVTPNGSVTGQLDNFPVLPGAFHELRHLVRPEDAMTKRITRPKKKTGRTPRPPAQQKRLGSSRRIGSQDLLSISAETHYTFLRSGPAC